jgi:hypothetical protein
MSATKSSVLSTCAMHMHTPFRYSIHYNVDEGDEAEIACMPLSLDSQA